MEGKQEIKEGLPPRPSDKDANRHVDGTEVIDVTLWRSQDEREGAAIADEAVDSVRVEASLLPRTRRLLRQLPARNMNRPYLAYLEQRIQRNPRDLESHVRRIVLEDARGDVDGICGAMVDLFLILGRRGRPLRRRLIRLVESKLTPEQRRFFRERLDSGIRRADARAALPQSRLSGRFADIGRLVVRREGDSDPDVDSVAHAREMVAAGRGDLAQALLERALEADPGDEAVCRELLGVYKRGNQRSEMLRTYTALIGRRLAVPQLWREVAADLRKERTTGGG